MSNSQYYLLAGSYDFYIHAFGLTDFQEAMSFKTGGLQANRIIVYGDRFYVASFGVILLYDITLQIVEPFHKCFFQEKSNTSDIAITPTLLLGCGEDKTIRYWDRRNSEQNFIIKTEDSLNAIICLDKYQIIIVGDEAGRVSMYDIKTSTCVYSVVNNNSPVRSISLSPDETSFLVCHMDGETLKYSFDNGGHSFSLVYKIRAHDNLQLRVVHSPDNTMFATTAGDNSAKIWSNDKGELICTFKPDSKLEWIWDAVFTPDSKRICTASSDGVCRLWDIGSQQLYTQTMSVNKCITAIGLI